MTKHCRNYRIRWQKKIDFSYSDPGGTLENKLNDLIPLFSRKKGFAFKKRRVNLADQTKQQSQRVSRTINDLSVWNKPLIDTYNIVRLACVASVSNRRESYSRSDKKKVEGGGGGKKRKRLPANPTILKNAPWYFTVRFVCKLTARQNRSITNRLPLDCQTSKITLFSNRTRSMRLQKL